LLLDGLNSADYPQMAAGALVIAVLALLLDALLAGLARLVVPVGVRLAGVGGSEEGAR
jgi:osmoprotectant transport system permease protein